MLPLLQPMPSRSVPSHALPRPAWATTHISAPSSLVLWFLTLLSLCARVSLYHRYLVVKYDKTNVTAGKAAAKEALQADVGLPVDPSAPLFSFIGRLEEQKGVDILLAAIPKALAKAPNAQVGVRGGVHVLALVFRGRHASQ